MQARHFAFLLLLGSLAGVHAQSPSRIAGPVVNSDRVQLAYSVKSEIARAKDEGPLDGQRELKSLMIFFNRTPAQEDALEQLLAAQLAPNSPEYHKWLTPEEFNERFGTNSDDIGKVKDWLTGLGFSNVQASRGGTFISFDGTVAEAEVAFSTPIHRYSTANGERHFANVSPISFPKAISTITAGVVGIDDFTTHPTARPQSVTAIPQYNNGLGVHSLVAEDLRTIYDVAPLYQRNIKGSNVTIIIPGEYALNNDDASIVTYRSLNGLSSIVLDVIALNGLSQTDSTVPNVEEEAYMDIEVAGGIAENATILYEYADDVIKAATDAIDQNRGQILSMSFSGCEPKNQTPVFEGALMQANAQGMTVLVSSGDTGAAGCDLGTSTTASNGLAVTYPASSIYVTAVGGTVFNENETYGSYGPPYWGSQDALGGSAVSYIPEDSWNDTIAKGQIGFASGGGVSHLFAAPTWQSSMSARRDVPDVAFAASSSHDGYLLCLPYTCLSGYSGSNGAVAGGGTSAAAPLFAGIVALVEQELGSQGAGLGNINARLYSLAQSSSYSSVFHDVTNGTNQVPAAGGGYIGYSATSGYDLVTGWGSIDANAFAVAMAGLPVTTSSSTTTVSSSAPQIIQGAMITLTAKVQSASGIPTGSVTFHDNGTTLSSVTVDSSGTGTYSTSALPVGSNSITASYGGDPNFRSSTSVPTVVTVIGSSLILPAPALTSPPNGGTNQLTTPVFIWSQVPNNSGYRIMVASSLAALPTDPNASSCVPTDSACVIDQAQSLTAGVNYYSVPSGVLLPGHTYYWQVHARASSPYLPGYWSVGSFSTSGGLQPPGVNTGAATSVTTNSATLTGTVNPNGLDTEAYFLYGTNIVLSGAIQTPPQDIGFGNTNSGLNANISGLIPGTQYYFQLVGSNNSGTTKGAINTFTTSNGSQAVLTIRNSVGGGVVSWDGPGVCASGYTCTYNSPGGAVIALEAIPTPGWFPAWTGCDSVSGYWCTVTMWLSRTVSVTYAQQPAPPITLQPTSLSFTSVTGVQSQVGQVFIINSGSSGLNPLTIAITGTNAANFNETNTCPASGLNAGNECIASVTFTPTSIGIASAFLSVSSSNAASSPMLVPLSGTGTSGHVIAPSVQLTPSLTSITTAQTLSVAISVNGGTGNPIPTGSVSLISGSYTSQPTPLINGNAMVSVPAGALSVGTDQLTAAYQGDSNYSSQNGTSSVTVTGAQISCSSYSSSTDQLTGITQPLRLGFGNGKLVAGSVGQAYIVDPISSQITTIPFSQYAGGISGKVSVINSQAFIPISNLSQGELAVISLGTAAVSQYVQVGVEPYGSLLAGNQLYIGDSVSSGNGTPSQVYVINPASGQIATSISAGHVIQSLVSDPVHNTIYALNYNDATASVIDLGSDSVVATIPLGIMPTSGIVVNDKLLVVGDVPQTQQGKIVEVDTSSNSVEGASLAVGRDPFEIVAVNGCAFVPNTSDSTVSVVDLTNNDVVKTISAGIGTNPTGAAVDPFSGKVYIANQVGNSISILTPGSTSTPTITVTPSATSIATAQSLTVMITVNGGAGNPVPTGAVLITSGSYTSAATTLNGGSATVVIPAGLLNQGNDTLAVSYTPDSSSSSTYNSAIGVASVLVSSSRTTPSVVVTPSASRITTSQQLTVTVTVNGGTGNPTPTGTVTLTGGGYTSANAALSSGSAQVNIPSNSLSVGTDSLAATYTPDSSSSSIYNSASGSTTVTVTTPAKTTPTVGVTLSSSSITAAQPLTVTVSVSGGTGNPTPTGTATLTGGGYASAATTLTGGIATINIPANSLSAGTDSLAVSYTPDSSSSSTYNSASGSATVTVTTPAKITPTVTVTPSSNSITTTQSLTVTVSVSGGSSNPTPSGTVTLSGGGYTSAAKTLSGSNAMFSIPANSLSAGTDSLVVSYTPDSSSSSTYNSASGSATVTVTTPAKITPTVTVTPSSNSITTTQSLTVTVSVIGGSGNPTPSGTVTLNGGGYISGGIALSSGSAQINIPANSLSAGTDSLVVSYTPDSASSSTYTSASGSATVTVTTPAKITPTVTVTPSSNSITTAQSLTITVSVSGGSGNPTPTGTVTLSSGGYSSQQTLSAGTANFTIAAGTLVNGANTLSASYSGDPAYSVANSTSTVIVEPVSMSATTPAQVNPGHSTSSTVNLTGSHGYSGTMKLICSLKSSPAGAQSLPTCALNPTSVILPVDGSGTSTLTVNTTAASTTASAHPTDRHLWKLGGGAILAALLFLGGIPSQRRRSLSWMLLLLIAMAGAIACGGGGGTSGSGGGGGSGTPATTAGTYSFAVIATDSVDANITVSTTVSVTVQ